ncbi:MAG: hypothetical protein AAFQ07_14950, partial [Chloroflexota bacterium]
MARKGRLVTTNLDVLRPMFQRGIELPAKMGWESFVTHEKIRADKVEEYRKFSDGDHDVDLSQEMKDMLRTDSLHLNHCENILETLSDRIRLAGIQVNVMSEAGEPDEGATERANRWVETLTARWNRLDGMQIDLHDAIPRDGMSFIMAQYDNETRQVVWTHEEAFDGHEGVIVVWGNKGNYPTLAIKIWHETQKGDKSEIIDNIRFNLYFPDRIEKYISTGGGTLSPHKDDAGDHVYTWSMADGSPIGVAIVPFVYKGRKYNKHGLGRLESVLSMQRATNRIINSMVMTSENIGFPVRFSFGLDVPAAIKPGTWLKATVPTMKMTADGKTKVPLSP